MSFVLLKVIGLVIPLRAEAGDESSRPRRHASTAKRPTSTRAAGPDATERTGVNGSGKGVVWVLGANRFAGVRHRAPRFGK